MRKKGKWTIQKHYLLASEESPFQCVHEMLLVMLPCSCLPACCALQVGKDDIDNSRSTAGLSRLGPSPLVNQYSLTVGLDLGPHDTKSLMKCVESLSFIVRDAAHVTPENFELCVKTIRIFVEASLNGGKMALHMSTRIQLGVARQQAV